MQVVAAAAPFLECRARERDGPAGSGPRVEIDIGIHGEPLVAPVAAEESSGIEINDVVREYEGYVFLLPRAHELVFGAEREDVVPHDIFPAVMLVEPGALAAVDDVVFQHHPGAAFVRVEAPAAV